MFSSKIPLRPKQSRIVYLDHAAATYLDKRVLEKMQPYFCDIFANPSALYSIGKDAGLAVKKARQSVAEILGAQTDTIIFTGSGTESDNLAVLGVARKHQAHGRHIITTKIEHEAVINPCEKLAQEGFEVTYLSPDKSGYVGVEMVRKALRPDTILVSIMYANNEIGTVYPIADIGREILKWRKETKNIYPFFHTDACQAAGSLILDVEKLHVDLMSINGSKLYGPKGVGVLYKRNGVLIEPLVYGGGQEAGWRSGTENVPGIVGMAEALKLVQSDKENENVRLIKLRNYFWGEIKNALPSVELNGPELSLDLNRLPNNLNISFPGLEGEALLLYLNEYGVVCSTGSACASESADPSHVLLACGRTRDYALSSVRFTLGKKNKKSDIDYVMKHLPGIVQKLAKKPE